LPSIVLGIVLISGGLEGYLLGLGTVRPILRLPLAAAGFAFSFPGMLTTLVGGGISALLALAVWLDNRDTSAVTAE
jgi:hypothetical protein